MRDCTTQYAYLLASVRGHQQVHEYCMNRVMGSGANHVVESTVFKDEALRNGETTTQVNWPSG